MFRNQLSEDRFLTALEKFVAAFGELAKAKTEPMPATENFDTGFGELTHDLDRRDFVPGPKMGKS
jgi:hypothetical protein